MKKLLEAVHAAPDDDAPRLVYADHLMERGDPRGELIQLQCELVGIDEDDVRYHRMKRRERTLLKQHGEEWTKELRALNKHLTFEFHRGFVEGVAGPADLFERLGRKLLTLAPLLRRLGVVSYDSRSIESIVKSGLFGRAISIRIYSGRSRVDLGPLSAITEATSIRRLHLDEVGLVRTDFDALATSGAFRDLRELEITSCRIGKDGPLPLERLPAQLSRFSIVTGKEPRALVRAVSEGVAFAKLDALGLCNNSIGDEGLAAITAAKRLATPREVDLRSTALSRAALMKLIKESLPERGLLRLQLGGNAIDDAVVSTIASWAGAAELVKLDLGSSDVTDKGARALARSPHLTKLRSLVLSNANVKAATEEALLASESLAKARLYVGSRFLSRA